MKEPLATPHFPDLEKNILAWWKSEKVFDQTLEKTKNGAPFIFYEGPPTANGKPHIGHVLGRSFKDLFPRYKTMQGFNVPRKAGWDSHGLPVELEIEKELGITGKQQIEEFGIEEFNKKCRESVFRHIEIWQHLTERMGFWVDLENAYVVMSPAYIESLWWVLKELWDKELLKKDYKVAPYCTRCQTPISSHELAQGYQDNVADPSLFALFKMHESAVSKQTSVPVYFLAWTTTPWTLVGNVALAVDPDATYVLAETIHPMTSEHIAVVLAKARLETLTQEYKVVSEFSGFSLDGLTYEPLFNVVQYDKPAHRVVMADFVSLDDGTGIVHTAVMYGEDDFNLGKKYDLPREHVVDLSGKYTEETGTFAGTYVIKANDTIISDLSEKGNIYKSETIHHTYPYCWRCKNKLIYYALESWFIATSDRKENLLNNNNEINWVPDHLKEGRMGDWLRNVKDWSISRWRYWGTPLPIWRCNDCSYETIVGSYDELQQKATESIDLSTFDPHRPYIDRVKLRCEKCNGEMTRYEDVIDTWFDSGAMPYAQLHYPFENQDTFNAQFPADFICEGIDQTRGWFYTLLAEATTLDRGIPAKNILCYEMVLDSNGRKMSKSVGNVIDPFETFEEFGADIMRWYFYSTSQIGKPYRLGKKELQEVRQRFINILWNSYRFFVTNALMDNWQPNADNLHSSEHVLDRWIIVRLNELINTVTTGLETYDAYTGSRAISDFIVADLSQWYIRRSRDRVGPSAMDADDKHNFYSTSYQIFKTISQLMAPFTPFIAEEMYRNLRRETDPASVHLLDWPKSDDSLIDRQVLDSMSLIRAAAEKIHATRKEVGIKVRQPLAEARIATSFTMINKEPFVQILSEEVNIRQITIIPSDEVELDVSVDTEITDQLKQEGTAREIVRSAQELRRQAGYKLDQHITLMVVTDSEYLQTVIGEFTPLLQSRLIADDIKYDVNDVDAQSTIELDGETLTLGVKAA